MRAYLGHILNTKGFSDKAVSIGEPLVNSNSKSLFDSLGESLEKVQLEYAAIKTQKEQKETMSEKFDLESINAYYVPIYNTSNLIKEETKKDNYIKSCLDLNKDNKYTREDIVQLAGNNEEVSIAEMKNLLLTKLDENGVPAEKAERFVDLNLKNGRHFQKIRPQQ